MPIDLNTYLKNTGERLRYRLQDTAFLCQLGAGPIKDRLLDYVNRGGKNLRPAMTCLACGALGGDPDAALDVGIAIEMTHTWTLVHDDIIDRDDTRRGGPSVHARIRMDHIDWGQNNPGMSTEHLGLSMALLVGDAQHAMAMDILSRTGLDGTLPADIVLFLIAELEGKVLPALLSGEVDDVFQTGIPLQTITRDEILLMLQRKTAALLTFSVIAGGMIGLGRVEPFHPGIHALRTYGNSLGLAFQLRDDILGIIGDVSTIGKPVGSDFKEGKRTLAVKTAWENGSPADRSRIEHILGKSDMSLDEIQEMQTLVKSLGGVAAVEDLAAEHIKVARHALQALPDSAERDLLESIAEFTVSRTR
ncbi:polyprenyl synthetase family protein [bacterium]|nr:polyprenyl synthetase family protein [candidate division CSSED10-310 bacterium]